MRFFALIVSLLFSLSARENPFSDVQSGEAFPISTNMPQVLSDLKHETFQLPDSARIVKRVIIEYQNLDGSIDKIESQLDKNIDWHEPIVLRHNKAVQQQQSYKEKVKLPFINFSTKGSQMRIATKDKLLRHFMLPRPHRIVLDFSGSSRSLHENFSNFDKPFKRVRLGNHSGYYRVVVELDGKYEYKETSDVHGITLTVK